MGDSVPVRCPECLSTQAYAAPVFPCACGSPVAPVVAAGAVAEPLTRRSWTDEWVTVRCGACGRENDWPHPELGCQCGTVLRVRVSPAGGGDGSGGSTEPGGPGDLDEPGHPSGLGGPGAPGARRAGNVTGAGDVAGGPAVSGAPGAGPYPGAVPPRAADPDAGSGTGASGPDASRTGGSRADSPRADDGHGIGGAGTHGPDTGSDTVGPHGRGTGPGSVGPHDPDTAPGPGGPPRQESYRAFAERYPAHIPLPPTGPRPVPGRGIFRPVTIRTGRDAVAAAAGYLRWLGFRDVVQPEERPASGVDLRAAGLVAQVDPSTRPTGLRAVECLWLNGLSTSAVSVFFSLAGYTPEARARAAEIGLPLFVLDLTGTPQPVNRAADDLAAGGA